MGYVLSVSVSRRALIHRRSCLLFKFDLVPNSHSPEAFSLRLRHQFIYLLGSVIKVLKILIEQQAWLPLSSSEFAIFDTLANAL